MRVPTTLRLAWRNLGRNRRRTMLALTTIAVAQLALLFTHALMLGYADAMVDAVTGPMLGHVQVHAPDWREKHAMDLVIEDVDEDLAAIRGEPGVKRATARIYAPVLLAEDIEGHMGVVLGLDPVLESEPGGLLQTVPEAERPRDHRVLVGAGLAEAMGLERGDEIAIVGQAADGSIANDLYTVAGTTTSSIAEVQRLGILMSLDSAQELFVMPDQAHEIVVVGESSQEAEALAQTVARTPGLDDAEVLPWQEIVPELVSVVHLSEVSSLIVLLLVFIAAAAGIANTMLMAIFERSRELGMLLALGATPGRLIRTIVAEAVALGLSGVAVGTVLGVVAVKLATVSGIDLTTFGQEAAKEVSFGGLYYSFSIVPRLEVSTILQGVGAVVITSLLASLWPAVHASRLEPMEAMRR